MIHMQLPTIDRHWTLFLDRDGVINEEKIDDYIHRWEEFRFYEGALEAIRIFSGLFGHLFIVTNQRGVAKGVTRLEDLRVIHENMLREIEAAGGRIDRLYYCIDADPASPNRKPNPGMGLQARADFPDVDLSKSMMIGNTSGDMQFGRNLGVASNILIRTRKNVDPTGPDIDFSFDSLREAAGALAHR